MLTDSFSPSNPDVLIIGEYASSTERKNNAYLSGTTGKYLLESLHGAGFRTDNIFYQPLLPTSPMRGQMDTLFVTKTAARTEKICEINSGYPKPQLTEARSAILKLIARLKPTLIITLGDVPMWAVGGIKGSAVTWNGSMLTYQQGALTCNFMPIISPITVSRMWSFNIYFRHALSKASKFTKTLWKEPDYNFLLEPTYQQTTEYLENILVQLECGPMHISCDLETRAGHIACLGLGTSELDAICIPFMQSGEPCAYWKSRRETDIILLLKRILTHPNAKISGQNYNYDRQYFARYWGFRSNLTYDTMTLHHTRNPDLKKGLDTLGFLYMPYYRYWKDESKDWDPKLGELQLWRYNCIDCVVTYGVAERLKNRPTASDPFYLFQHSMQEPVLDMTLRGTKCDIKLKNQMTEEVLQLMTDRADWFVMLAGKNVNSKSKKFWYDSPQQIGNLLYDVMKIAPVYNKKGKNKMSRTTDDKALVLVAKREPLARLLCQRLQEYKSLRVFHNTFLTMKLDWDNRIRCQYMIDGTKTFRFASMGDAFHFGTNLQNIPKGNE